MTDRIIDIGRQGAFLHVRHNNLIVEQDGEEVAAVPLPEIGALSLSHPRITMTHTVLAGITEAGGAIVLSDTTHKPVGMVLPLNAHHAQTARFAKQAELGAPARKRMWQALVQAKIRAQGAVLNRLHGEDKGLIPMAGRVKSGDTNNMEAQAARRYWPALFDDPAFRRTRDAGDQNRHLNFGYAVLRATVARAACAAGLHPSLGIHHHNQYNPFCLADDLMEPFRPLIDYAVAVWVQDKDPKGQLDTGAKAALIAPCMARYRVDDEERTLFDIVTRLVGGVVAVIEGRAASLTVPDLWAEIDDARAA